MAKKIKPEFIKAEIKQNLVNKYRALFLNIFEIEGLDYRVDKYIMTKLLGGHKVAAFWFDTNEQIREVGFGTYVEEGFDHYGEPIQIRIMNERGSPFIPTKSLVVGEDTVIIRLDVIPENFIQEVAEHISEIKMTARTNLKTLKVPFVISGADPKVLKALEDLLDNEEVIFLDDTTIKVMGTSVQFHLDKLLRYQTAIEAELLTTLGIDNVKFEKSAQMSLDEVNANNEEISAYRGILKRTLEVWFEQINQMFGTNITIKEQEVVVEQFPAGGDEDDI